MEHHSYYFPDASNTAQLFAQYWQPEQPPRAILQIIHGVNEYGGRYATFAHYLTERGFAVAVHDQMGHGASVAAGEKHGLWAEQDGWMSALADINNFTAQLRQKWPDTPLFLFGHSLGSFMLRDLLIREAGDYAGAVISGTGSNAALLYDAGIALCAMMKLFKGGRGKSPLVRDMCFGGYSKAYASENNSAAWISRDPAVYEAYVRDPWCRFLPSIELFSQMFKGMRHMDAPANYRHIRSDLPLLMISGDADPVGNFGKGTKLVYERLRQAGCRDLQLKLYPGARHEVLNELCKEQAYQDIAEWLEQRLA